MDAKPKCAICGKSLIDVNFKWAILEGVDGQNYVGIVCIECADELEDDSDPFVKA